MLHNKTLFFLLCRLLSTLILFSVGSLMADQKGWVVVGGEEVERIENTKSFLKAIGFRDDTIPLYTEEQKDVASKKRQEVAFDELKALDSMANHIVLLKDGSLGRLEIGRLENGSVVVSAPSKIKTDKALVLSRGSKVLDPWQDNAVVKALELESISSETVRKSVLDLFNIFSNDAGILVEAFGKDEDELLKDGWDRELEIHFKPVLRTVHLNEVEGERSKFYRPGKMEGDENKKFPLMVPMFVEDDIKKHPLVAEFSVKDGELLFHKSYFSLLPGVKLEEYDGGWPIAKTIIDEQPTIKENFKVSWTENIGDIIESRKKKESYSDDSMHFSYDLKRIFGVTWAAVIGEPVFSLDHRFTGFSGEKLDHEDGGGI